MHGPQQTRWTHGAERAKKVDGNVCRPEIDPYQIQKQIDPSCETKVKENVLCGGHQTRL